MMMRASRFFILFTVVCFFLGIDIFSWNSGTMVMTAGAKLITTLSKISPPFFNVSVIDPETAQSSQVIYANTSLAQFDVISPGWDSKNRIMYLPALDLYTTGIPYYVIGVRVDGDGDGDLSTATLIGGWSVVPLSLIYAMQFDPVTNNLYLIGLVSTKPFYVYSLNVGNGTLRLLTELPDSFVLDIDTPSGSASVLDVKKRLLAVPTYDKSSAQRYLTVINIDTLDIVHHQQKQSIPFAMFINPSTNSIGAVLSDIGTSALSYGTVDLESGALVAKRQWPQVNNLTMVISGFAPLDNANQLFYTMIADDNGRSLSLVTVDASTGVIKKLVRWPQQQIWPGTLLVV